ncbi:2'-deoxycytidine 5'-triphosphate deaminase [Candidatus Pacearchaeota archaeon]|nr:2'-deoxycytidine 5'-triphosphate deaminase [Candidatus Pacearchaeota archaeon]
MAGEVLSDNEIKKLIKGGAIIGADNKLVNPASLDLRITKHSWRLLGSVLPLEKQKIKDIIDNSGAVDTPHEGEGGKGFYIERSQPYLFKLKESLKLPQNISARFFNKSGRGRIGTSVKGLCDGVPRFDTIPLGYSGDLYAEICATAFPEVLRSEETAMPQIRFYRGHPEPIKEEDLELLLRKDPILLDKNNKPIKFEGKRLERLTRTGKITFTADLSKELCYYRAKKDSKTIDLSKKGYYDPEDFFEEVNIGQGKKTVIIHPEEFVLMFPKEKIRLPPTLAAEISDYSSDIGDIKVHYAGLMNPGHGYHPEEMRGDYIAFEIRARDIPIVIQDGQELARFELFKMSKKPEIEYREVQSTGYDTLFSILPKQFNKEKKDK